MRRTTMAGIAGLVVVGAAVPAWSPGEVARAGIELKAGHLPALREAEPVARPVRGGPPARRSAVLERRARQIIGRDRRSGALHAVLGSTEPSFVQIGELRAGGRRLGATALLALRTPRYDVRATLPGYVPAGAGYRSRSVRMTAVVLRDLLVDIDVRRGRVIAVQPGPRSQTSFWAPQGDPTPSGVVDED